MIGIKPIRIFCKKCDGEFVRTGHYSRYCPKCILASQKAYKKQRNTPKFKEKMSIAKDRELNIRTRLMIYGKHHSIRGLLK